MRLTFLSPLLADDLELVGRPVTYLGWESWATDGREHEVSIYYDNTAELVVDKPTQAVLWSRPKMEGLEVLRMGSLDQPVLAKAGDNLRIDWGYLYVAAPTGADVHSALADHESAPTASPCTGGCHSKTTTACRGRRTGTGRWRPSASGPQRSERSLTSAL